MKSFPLFLILISFYTKQVVAQDSSSFTKTEIIYGRKDGMALTMLMLVPKEGLNHKAVISVASGNWVSNHNNAGNFVNRSHIYLAKGYTVFVVIHGSQPRYSIPNQVADIKRAVRFIRYHSGTYKIDGDKLGITGSSSGGHLALMVGLSDDKIDSLSRDPIDKVSSRVQAVAVFYPPVDFLNWGQDKMDLSKLQAALTLAGVAGAFDFREWNDTVRLYQSVTPERKLAIAKQVSPVYNVTADDPPVLIIHGDADRVVPIQQSQTIIKKLNEAKVTNDFIIKKDGGHGWRDQQSEEKNFVDWFAKYLK